MNCFYLIHFCFLVMPILASNSTFFSVRPVTQPMRMRVKSSTLLAWQPAQGVSEAKSEALEAVRRAEEAVRRGERLDVELNRTPFQKRESSIYFGKQK